MKTGSSFSAGGRSSRIPSSSATAALDVHVEEELHVVGDEADRHDDDIGDAARVQLAEMLAEVWSCPGLGSPPRGLIAPRPTFVGEPRTRGDELRVSRH